MFGELAGGPRPGHEIWTSSFGHGPGGIANFAVAGARLGVPTAIAAAVGTDPFSLLVRAALAGEGVTLDHLVILEDWALPVTASLSYDDDRALVTGGVPCPLDSDELVPGGAGRRRGARAPGSAPQLLDRACRRRGHRRLRRRRLGPVRALGPRHPRPARRLPRLHPQRARAAAYTGAGSAVQAARALAARVPLSVVTSGSRGVVAVDAARGEEVVRPPLAVRAIDATGAGDVFGAALAASARAPWTLTQRIDFACLVAGITVTRPGGASGAPRLDELSPGCARIPRPPSPAATTTSPTPSTIPTAPASFA